MRIEDTVADFWGGRVRPEGCGGQAQLKDHVGGLREEGQTEHDCRYAAQLWVEAILQKAKQRR